MTIAPGTAAFYDQWAVAGEEARRSALSRHFEVAFAPGARVLMAVPEMPSSLLVDGRDPDGRAFVNHSPERVAQLFGDLGFTLLRSEDIPTPSTGTRWRVLLFGR